MIRRVRTIHLIAVDIVLKDELARIKPMSKIHISRRALFSLNVPKLP